jgi:hypothetical protein
MDGLMSLGTKHVSYKQMKFQNPLNVKRISSQIQ